MSLKRTVQYWRIGFIAISIMILLSVPGCGDTHLEDEQVRQLLSMKLINDFEYEKIKKRLMRDYGVVSNITT